MAAQTLRPSPLSVAVALVLSAVAILVFALTKGNADHQNGVLLRDEAAQASLIATSTFTGYVSEVTGPLATAAVVNPNALQPMVTTIATAGRSVGLLADVFRRSGGRFIALAAAGPSQQVGVVATGPLADTLSAAQTASTPQLAIFPQYVPAPVHRHGAMSTLAFAQAVTQGSPTVVYFGFTIDPYTWVSQLVQKGGPFEQLRAVLYGSSSPDASSIVVATTHDLPLRGAVNRSVVSVGTHRWLLFTQARSPLVGTLGEAAPWAILVLGLVLAVVLAATVEVLVRRQRYAAQVAEQRASQLLQAQEALLRQERLSALGELATVIGHELRNPLGAVINAAFLARRRLTGHDDPELAGHLDIIEGEVNRAAKLSEDLTTYMRERKPEISLVDLRSVIGEVLESSPPPTKVTVYVEDPVTDVMADSGQLIQMLTNLVTNAYQAMPEVGSLRLGSVKRDGFVTITVRDTGHGIDPTVSDRLFEPFFSTKATGTGLGLAIVKRLAEAHGGQVSIDNAPEGGTVVTLLLPDPPPEPEL